MARGAATLANLETLKEPQRTHRIQRSGADVCFCLDERPDRRLLILERSPMQRRVVNLRMRLPVSQAQYTSFLAPPATLANAPSTTDCPSVVKLNGGCGIVLEGFWAVRKLVAGDTNLFCGHHINPVSV